MINQVVCFRFLGGGFFKFRERFGLFFTDETRLVLEVYLLAIVFVAGQRLFLLIQRYLRGKVRPIILEDVVGKRR